MSEQKKPSTGEFWRTRGGDRRYVAAVLPESMAMPYKVITIDEEGMSDTYTSDGVFLESEENDCDLITHLPWCTSFNDVEPAAEVWPKWYVPLRNLELSGDGKLIAYAVRYTSTTGETVHTDGTSFKWVNGSFGAWLEVPESEAIARLNLPAPTCPDCNQPLTPGHADVCPEAWVEITDPEHVLRSRIDHLELSNSCGWISVEGMTGETVDRSKRVFGFGSVRTRRKNLPPLPLPVPQPSTPDPGDGWRLIDKAVDVPQEGDQVNCCIDIEHQCWANHPQTEPFDMSPVSHYRRRITPATNSPFGDAMSEPETVPIQFMVPRRILDGGDWPVRACLAGEQISDSATWLPVTIDRLGNTSVRKAVQE